MDWIGIRIAIPLLALAAYPANCNGQYGVDLTIAPGSTFGIVKEIPRSGVKLDVNGRDTWGCQIGYTESVGNKSFIRFGIGVQQYRLLKIQSDNGSLCCSTFDSLNLEVKSLTLAIAPEFKLTNLSNFRFIFPLRFAWPISTKAHGLRRISNQTDEIIDGPVSNFGRFNIHLGFGLNYQFGLSDKFALAFGPNCTYGFIKQSYGSGNVRVAFAEFRISITRKLPKSLFPAE